MAGTTDALEGALGAASLGRTTSICPRCKRLLDAELIERDGRLIPFCAYNSVGYREQVRLEMSQRGS